MQGNNTTIIEDCLDCVSESSSLLDDVEIVLVALAALAGIAAWAYKKYKALNADGKITLDEIIDSMDEVKEKTVEAKAQLKTVDEVLESRNVAELKVMLKEKGLAVSGKKADLVARLKASVSESDRVVDIRLDNLEATAKRHERLIEQLVQSNMDMKTGLAQVATELEVTNGLIASYMGNNQKIVFALIAIVAGAMGISTQM